MKSETEIRITETEVASQKASYSAGAAELLARIRAFYADPENEKAFQEWKKKEGRA